MRILKLDMEAEKTRDPEALERFMGLNQKSGDMLEVRLTEPGTFEITGNSFGTVLAMNPSVTTPAEVLKVNLIAMMVTHVADGVKKAIALLAQNKGLGDLDDVFILGGFAQGLACDSFEVMSGHTPACVAEMASLNTALGFSLAMHGMAAVRDKQSDPIAWAMRDLARGKAGQA